ncbi:MAG: NAD-dependent epimerase/dehydratase family protein [Syntrophobacteraceae bacterium]
MLNPFEWKPACVVTGVAGFVGSHLAERLLSLGFPVVGVDNFISGYQENMTAFHDHPGFTFYERSIEDASLLRELKTRHPELACCFHLAAIVSVPFSVDHPDETLRINYSATSDLLKEAESLHFSAFVFAGSAAEYGDDPRLPLREEYATSTTRHLSPYGEAKFRASAAVGASPCGVALRFFNIYGPRQDPSSPYSGVISKFMDLAVRGKALTVFGDGLQTRDFIYVSDVVDAYLAAAGLRNAQAGSPRLFAAGRTPRIYNVGSGKVTSILDLGRMLLSLIGEIRPFTHLPERPGDIRHSHAVVDAFCGDAGWTARVSLKEGLARTLDWFRLRNAC